MCTVVSQASAMGAPAPPVCIRNKELMNGAPPRRGSRPEITAIEAGTIVPVSASPKPSPSPASAVWVAFPTLVARFVVESEQDAGWRGPPMQQSSRTSTRTRR